MFEHSKSRSNASYVSQEMLRRRTRGSSTAAEAVGWREEAAGVGAATVVMGLYSTAHRGQIENKISRHGSAGVSKDPALPLAAVRAIALQCLRRRLLHRG